MTAPSASVTPSLHPCGRLSTTGSARTLQGHATWKQYSVAPAPGEQIERRQCDMLATTAYGLYRDDIRDVVRVAGSHNKTPLIEFLSKGSLFAILAGENLSEYHVAQAMQEVLRQLDLTLRS